MSTPTNILDKSTKRSAIVTSRGQLVTSPLEFSDPVFHSLVADNVSINWFKPLAGKRLVITDVIVQTDRSVTTQALIDIYETSDEESETIVKSIFQFDLKKQESLVLTGLNIIITEGVFINAKADDSNVLITIGGYFVEA